MLTFQPAIVDSIDGLPLHPLVVHAVVVLLPLAALGLVAISFVPRWSVRYGPLVWPVALVALISAFIADQSGRELALKVGVPAEHMQAGEQVKFVAAGVLVMSLVVWLLDRKATKAKRSILEKVLAGVAVAVSLLAIYVTFLAGDSGARAVWG